MGNTDMGIDRMSMDELKALRGRIEMAIASAERQRRVNALAAVEEAAQRHGVKLTELLGGARRGRGKLDAAKPNALARRYANPDDVTQTWSGRGRRPQWVQGALESGKTLEDLEI